jgi:hypothetical protein
LPPPPPPTLVLPIIFLPHFWGLTGLELCQPIANILSGLVSIPFIIVFFRKFSMQKKVVAQ